MNTVIYQDKKITKPEFKMGQIWKGRVSGNYYLIDDRGYLVNLKGGTSPSPQTADIEFLCEQAIITIEPK